MGKRCRQSFQEPVIYWQKPTKTANQPCIPVQTPNSSKSSNPSTNIVNNDTYINNSSVADLKEASPENFGLEEGEYKGLSFYEAKINGVKHLVLHDGRDTGAVASRALRVVPKDVAEKVLKERGTLFGEKTGEASAWWKEAPKALIEKTNPGDIQPLPKPLKLDGKLTVNKLEAQRTAEPINDRFPIIVGEKIKAGDEFRSLEKHASVDKTEPSFESTKLRELAALTIPASKGTKAQIQDLDLKRNHKPAKTPQMPDIDEDLPLDATFATDEDLPLDATFATDEDLPIDASFASEPTLSTNPLLSKNSKDEEPLDPTFASEAPEALNLDQNPTIKTAVTFTRTSERVSSQISTEVEKAKPEFSSNISIKAPLPSIDIEEDRAIISSFKPGTKKTTAAKLKIEFPSSPKATMPQAPTVKPEAKKPQATTNPNPTKVQEEKFTKTGTLSNSDLESLNKLSSEADKELFKGELFGNVFTNWGALDASNDEVLRVNTNDKSLGLIYNDASSNKAIAHRISYQESKGEKLLMLQIGSGANPETAWVNAEKDSARRIMSANKSETKVYNSDAYRYLKFLAENRKQDTYSSIFAGLQTLIANAGLEFTESNTIKTK